MEIKITIPDKIKKQVFSSLLLDSGSSALNLSPETYFVLNQILEQMRDSISEDNS